MGECILVNNEADYLGATGLFREYAAWLNIDLSFQHFENELIKKKSIYTFPLGGILLYKEESAYVACIAFRKQEDSIAELKRMYVKPLFQRGGVGEKLLHQALSLAKDYGYSKIRLDTLKSMTPAMALYQRNGFYEIDPYYYNPQDTAVFFEKIL